MIERIDIKPVDSKQREIINHLHEYIEIADDYILYSLKQRTREWDENEDDDSIDNYIEEEKTEKIIDRSACTKIKKQNINGIEINWSEANERWMITILCNASDEMDILFATEKEALKVYKILDNYIFKT